MAVARTVATAGLSTGPSGCGRGSMVLLLVHFVTVKARIAFFSYRQCELKNRAFWSFALAQEGHRAPR